MSNLNLGKRILEDRKNKGLSIRDFSKLSGLSTSILSQIERGIANPSIHSLRLIAKTLNVPLYTLFIDDVDHQTLILKKADRKKIYRENADHIVFDLLTPDYMQSNVDILWSIINPHAETTPSYMQHNKEEHAIVIHGSVWVVMEDKEYLLEEGDAVRVLPRMQHKFVNRSADHCEILFILSTV